MYLTVYTHVLVLNHFYNLSEDPNSFWGQLMKYKSDKYELYALYMFLNKSSEVMLILLSYCISENDWFCLFL